MGLEKLISRDVHVRATLNARPDLVMILEQHPELLELLEVLVQKNKNLIALVAYANRALNADVDAWNVAIRRGNEDKNPI